MNTCAMNAEDLDLPDATVRIWRGALTPAKAAHCLKALEREIPWRRDALTFGGVGRAIPRGHAWLSDTSTFYAWSGLTMVPSRIGPTVRECLTRAQELVQPATPFGGVLANLYADGFESVGWHADDERVMGPEIASLSFGASRAFLLRRKDDKRNVVQVDLDAGDLLLMAGTTQQFWEHALLKTYRACPLRISLTCRQLNV